MLPKPVGSEEEKLLPRNWRPIRLMSAINRICFGMIANYFQEIHHPGTSGDKKDLVARNQ
jgi:hypothetical protein